MEFATVPGALTYLSELGSSAAIADELERRKIRSKPGCPESCAVADFIVESVGVYQVTIDGDDAAGFSHADTAGESPVPTHPFRVVLPDVVHEFVVDFDCGKYPTLINAVGSLWDVAA